MVQQVNCMYLRSSLSASRRRSLPPSPPAVQPWLELGLGSLNGSIYLRMSATTPPRRRLAACCFTSSCSHRVCVVCRGEGVSVRHTINRSGVVSQAREKQTHPPQERKKQTHGAILWCRGRKRNPPACCGYGCGQECTIVLVVMGRNKQYVPILHFTSSSGVVPARCFDKQKTNPAQLASVVYPLVVVVVVVIFTLIKNHPGLSIQYLLLFQPLRTNLA